MRLAAWRGGRSGRRRARPRRRRRGRQPDEPARQPAQSDPAVAGRRPARAAPASLHDGRPRPPAALLDRPRRCRDGRDRVARRRRRRGVRVAHRHRLGQGASRPSTGGATSSRTPGRRAPRVLGVMTTSDEATLRDVDRADRRPQRVGRFKGIDARIAARGEPVGHGDDRDRARLQHPRQGRRSSAVSNGS